MKQFDKVVCICDYTYNNEKYLTKDKHYVVLDNTINFVNPRFLEVSEIRDIKLKQLGL